MEVCLFLLLFVYIIVERAVEVEDYIKCELIGGGSPRHFNTSSNHFIVGCTLHTYQYMPWLHLRWEKGVYTAPAP